jgi:glyoxylase I family protein
MKGKNSTIGGGGFHHLALRVRDFDKSIKFYSEVLGFKSKIVFPHPWDKNIKKIAMMETGDGNYMEIFSDGPKDLKTNGAFFHVAFRTDNVDAVIERIKKAGFGIIIEPIDLILDPDTPTILRVAMVKGPDGEELEFCQSTKGVML